MITVESTPNHAGVTVQGDYFDFEHLYDALHEITGWEDEYPAYYNARLRVLAICYDLRHAMMGHRGIVFVDNGLDDDKKRWRGIIAPDKNVYLTCNVLWPELLFCTMALNDFAELHAQKLSKNHYNLFEHKDVVWDSALAQVRMFQAAIYQCIAQTAPSTVLGRIRNMMLSYTSFDNYTTQYLDILNNRFLDWDKEQRVKNISIMVKRLVEKDAEYQEYRLAVEQAAKEYDCPPDMIRFGVEYQEEIDW
ncbi:MAG: hypothetical protein M0R49_02020 [Limnochordia bacterium]|nr:hypothetical protein [Limnochordia bacterium]